ncbi:unnamed protein product [Didymodactylos carnosus]|uniref:Uncharacterized protein n=1 Tax=Didymodactylos carnosus TaxID=1234261 RepID=A0A815HHB0_9BILA|nr:unnamed protein product [Didymodactylos carnosus]CAF4222550.1 unnamed protein product [Didymodactylos carnosus]
MSDSSTGVTMADKSIFSNLKNDIGSHIKSRLSLKDDIRYLLLKDHFVPSGNFKWPYSERNTHVTVEKRYLNQKHLKDNSWLVFSLSKNGLFCLPCALFATGGGGKSLNSGSETDEGLAKLILEELNELDLDPSFIVGQGYDGCSAMSGEFNGCHAFIQRLFPKALYLHCLQSPGGGIMDCKQLIDDIVFMFKYIRNEKLEQNYEEILDLRDITGHEVKMPLITGRQTTRSNVPSTTPQEYYRLNLFIPILDHFIASLNERFFTHQWLVLRVSRLIPAFIEGKTFDDIEEVVEMYQDLLHGSTTVIKQEFLLYQKKWIDIQPPDRPSNVMEAYLSCNETFYPNIKILLNIYATLPVTTATGERSFSILKRLKTYLRSTMSEDRLNGLAMLTINSDIAIDIDEVIDRFSRKKGVLILFYDYEYYFNSILCKARKSNKGKEIMTKREPPSLIISNLWLGCLQDAQDVEFLTTNGIQNIISICLQPLPKHENCIHYRFEIEDNAEPSSADTQYFVDLLDKAVPVLQQCNGHPTLIHCGVGRQRSAAVVAAYLAMKKFSGNVEEAVFHVMNRRATAFRVVDSGSVKIKVNWQNALSEFCKSKR